MKIKLSLISIITLIFINLTLIIGSSQITDQQQKIYATTDEDDNSDNSGESGNNDNDNSNDNDSIEINNDNNDVNSQEINDDGDENDNSNNDDGSSSGAEDPLNEGELTAENPPEITGEIVTGESSGFGIRDNLQVDSLASTMDDQTKQSDSQIVEPLNPDINFNDLIKEQSQEDILQEIPFQTTEPPVSKSSDLFIDKSIQSQEKQTNLSPSSAAKPSNPFVDLDDLLKEESSKELEESTDSIQPSSSAESFNPNVKLGDLLKEQHPKDPVQPSVGETEGSEDTSTVLKPSKETGLDNIVSPKNPRDSYISSRETNTIPGPPYSDEDESGEKCIPPFGACLEPLDTNPGVPEFRDAEICRNDKDDDNDGRVDEFPCSVVPDKSKPLPPNNPILTPEKSKGPSPFGDQ